MARLCTPNVSVDYDDSIDADQSFDTAFPSAATSMSWANTWPELQARADGAQQARRRSSRPSILFPRRRRCSPVRPRFTHTHTHTRAHKHPPFPFFSPLPLPLLDAALLLLCVAASPLICSKDGVGADPTSNVGLRRCAAGNAKRAAGLRVREHVVEAHLLRGWFA